MRTRPLLHALLISVLFVATAACSDDGEGTAPATTAPASAADGPTDDDAEAVDPGEAADPDTAGEGTVPRVCLPYEEVAALTDFPITGEGGQAAGSPSFSCQFVSDHDEASTGTAVRVAIDFPDDGPYGFGEPVAGLGNWAEVEQGAAYVGLGAEVLVVESLVDSISNEALVEVARAHLALGG